MTAVNQFLLYAFEYVRKAAPERERTKMSIMLFSFVPRKNAQQNPHAKVSFK